MEEWTTTLVPVFDEDPTITGPALDAYGVADWLGYLTREEVKQLQWLAKRLPENPLVVNIGAGGGTSALAFLQSRPDLRVCTIDIQANSSPLGCLEGELNALRLSGVNFQTRYWQICGDSKAIEWNLPIDLVFIDGDHSYEGCKGDIQAWLPRIKPGGFLVLHDYRKPAGDKPHPGVDQAVDELLHGVLPLVIRVDTVIAFRVWE
jgi:predicted O-methyltransferase YrrM